MFQYLNDLEENDKNTLSMFKFHKIEINEFLSKQFLEEWLKFEEENICNWNFEGETINKSQFVQNFTKDYPHKEEDAGVLTLGACVFSQDTDTKVSFILMYEK